MSREVQTDPVDRLANGLNEQTSQRSALQLTPSGGASPAAVAVDVASAHPDPAVREKLARAGDLLRQAAKRKRDVAARSREAHRVLGHEAPFAARPAIDGCLARLESEMRLTSLAFAAAREPAARRALGEALEDERDAADLLRQSARVCAGAADGATRCPIRRTGSSGGVRSRLEEELEQLSAQGSQVRLVVMSPDVLRELRRDRSTSGGGAWSIDAPVMVDFAWSEGRFAILTYDSTTLEELTAG